MVNNILDPDCDSCSQLEAIVAMQPTPQREMVIDGLLELDCKIYPAKSPEDAISKLQFHAFHIAILQEGYSLDVTAMLATMPMEPRRNIFFVIVGDALETGNHLQSYVLSANAVINTEDLVSLPSVLQNAFLDNNRFYRPLYYALEENI